MRRHPIRGRVGDGRKSVAAESLRAARGGPTDAHGTAEIGRDGPMSGRDDFYNGTHARSPARSRARSRRHGVTTRTDTTTDPAARWAETVAARRQYRTGPER